MGNYFNELRWKIYREKLDYIIEAKQPVLFPQRDAWKLEYLLEVKQPVPLSQRDTCKTSNQ